MVIGRVVVKNLVTKELIGRCLGLIWSAEMLRGCVHELKRCGK